MVMAPASTGSEVISRIAVIIKAQSISGKRSIETTPAAREHRMVVKKLILPKMEETPARCNLKIAKSTEIPL
jgi:hypothetical protein